MEDDIKLKTGFDQQPLGGFQGTKPKQKKALIEDDLSGRLCRRWPYKLKAFV
jgi:hypothetical protein